MKLFSFLYLDSNRFFTNDSCYALGWRKFFLVIFIFALALVVSSMPKAFALRIYYSQAQPMPGDFLFVVLVKQKDDKNLKAYVDGRLTAFYTNKINDGEKSKFQLNNEDEVLYFGQGFDAQYSPKTWHLKITTAKTNYQKTIHIKPLAKPITPGKVNFHKKKNITLSKNRKTTNQENIFFHPLFLADYPHKLWHGKWVYPVKEYKGLSSVYGKMRHYNGGRVSMHRGVDFRGRQGAPICAANKGEVVYVGKKMVRGNIVIVKHGPCITSSYWHLQSIRVKKGQVVQKGQVIGAMGLTGLATGVHLHWEVRIKNTCIDGKKLFDVFNQQTQKDNTNSHHVAFQLIGFVK